MAFFGRKETNRSVLDKQDKMKQGKHRDVYNTQQLKRGELRQAQTMTGRNILNGVATFFVVLIVWLGVSAFDMIGTGTGALELSGNPETVWFYVNESYVNVDNPAEHISVAEYNSRMATYAQAGKVEPVADPGDPPANDVMAEWEMLHAGRYQSNISGEYIDQARYDELAANADAIYAARLEKYNADKKAYDLYLASVNNPADTWKYQIAHYRNINNPEEYIREEEYEALKEEWRKDVDRNRISDDERNVPDLPMKLSDLYEPYEYGLVAVKTNLTGDVADPNGQGDLTLDGQDAGTNAEPPADMSIADPATTDPAVTEPGGGEGEGEATPPAEPEPPVETPPSEIQISDPGDINTANPSELYMFDAVGDAAKPWVNRMTGERISNADYEALKAQYDAGEGQGPQDPVSGGELVLSTEGQASSAPGEIPEGMEWGPISYRNKYDGSVITSVDYDAMVQQYEAALESYKSAYQAHRELYHPDDIDGTKKVFTMMPTLRKFFISIAVGAIFFGVLYAILKKNLDAENQLSTTEDINWYKNDQHIMLPHEIQQNYDWFPDVGAHSAVQVSSMISHMALLNKGLKRVDMARRAEKDVLDEDGDIEYYKGEILMDAEGKPITDSVPIIDEKFMDELFDASGAQKDKEAREKYDATKIPYNPDGKNRDKLGKYATVAELINADWEFPLYEPQRPGGAYIVDTAPVNTMVLAITRAGKGQTVIEPTIDMWLREKRPNNIVINDPKGELLVKNYVRATVRGLQVVQFNLINAMKTDIYNPLAMAADAAREGDNTKCAMYVENIAEVFFPLDGGEDPVWPNAANNAFKRAAYGLIDYYLEEEKAMRRLAERIGMDEKILEQKVDEMWGKVTLYNCYQLFVQLSSKKMKNPAIEFAAKAKNHEFDDLPDDVYKAELERVTAKSALWEDKQDADLLTLFFSATDALPRNSMRTLVANSNNALKAMGGADKMMASCEQLGGEIHKPSRRVA